MRNFSGNRWAILLVLFYFFAGIAFASDAHLTQLNLPEYIWLALVSGVVQGLIWFGAVNSKLTNLSDRMDGLEQERREDNRGFEARYESLLKILISTMKGKA